MRMGKSKWLGAAIMVLAIMVVAVTHSLIGRIWSSVPLGVLGRGEPASGSHGFGPSASATGDVALSLPVMKVTTPAEVRQVVRFTRGAQHESEPLLREMALHSPDPLVAGNAIGALGRLKAVTKDPDLLALLQDPRLRIRQEMVLALGLSEDPSRTSDLLPLLGDHELRPLAIHALGRLGNPDAVEPIEAILSDPRASETDRVFAHQAIASIEAAMTPVHPRRAPFGGRR